MSGKNQYPVIFNFQSNDPRLTFNPPANSNGSTPSGIATGTMTGTNTIYTQIIDVSRMDNGHAVLSWTGTPVGTFAVYTSDKADVWPSISIAGISNPAGTPAYQGINFTQFGFKFLMFQYANTSGTGVLTINMQLKDLN